jgi:phosphatidylglycerol:prolipoprotein diacylglycerol transferase
MHPVVFSLGRIAVLDVVLGPFQIYSYGVLLAIAFLAGLAVLLRDGSALGLSVTEMLEVTIWVILFSVAGARVLYVLLSLTHYANDPVGILLVYRGGFSFHGGAVGASLAVFILAARKRIPALRLTDAGVRPLIVASAIARVGCFMNGCCFGRPWDGPWAVQFPVLGDGISRHPAQLYDLTLHLALFAVVTFARKYKKWDGDITACYLIGFALLRLIVDLFRKGATSPILALGVTTAQWGSAACIVGALALFCRPRKTKALAAASMAPTPTGAR